jgi:hypothetical protein
VSREVADRSTWKRLLIFPLGLVVLVVLLTLWGVASLRTSERALEDGARARGAWDQRHAAEKSNDAAAQLAVACAPMGLDLSPSAGEPSAATEHMRRAVSHLFVQSRVGGFQRRQALPAELDAFLAAHAGDLDAATRVLLGEPPRWGFDPDPLAESRVPKSAGDLQEILLAAALQASLGGERGRADDLMLAAWRMEDAAERHPEGWGPPAWNRGEQLAALRLVRPADARGWIARLDELDLRGAVADGMYASARSLLAQQEATPQDEEAQLPSPLLAFRDSLARVGTGREVRATLGWEQELRALGPCERPMTGARRLAEEQPLLSLARGGGQGMFAAWPLLVLDDAEIEVALTRRVLARAAGLEPTPSPAGACVDDLVVEERHPDGSLTMRWSAELAPANGTRPREFTLAAGDVASGAAPP